MFGIYTRDYRIGYNEEEGRQYQLVCDRENSGTAIGLINHYPDYPEAVRHYLSLFPNHHIDPWDWTSREDFDSLIDGYEKIVHMSSSNERDTQQYIRNKGAYFIILSLLSYYQFGHHEAYIFPEFHLGNDYIPDYLLVGKSSGGYEFVFVELESPHGSIKIEKDRYLGNVPRKGLNQIDDWKRWLESNFNKLESTFKKELVKDHKLPSEFYEYDSSRIHFMLVAGTREDFNDNIYYTARDMLKNKDTTIKHYDNIIDNARNLKNRLTF